jgi:hypothetical protein
MVTTLVALRVNCGLANMLSLPSPAACVMRNEVRNTAPIIVIMVLICKKIMSLSIHPFAMKLACIM